MKRFISVIICFLIFSLCACGASDSQRADEIASPFIKALLIRDEESMKNYLHPDYKESALPNDEFYGSLEDNHFFSLGNELTSMLSVGKSNFGENVDGEITQYHYVIMTNELYYNVDLRILEDDKGYGIIAVSMGLNTEPELYIADEGEGD